MGSARHFRIKASRVLGRMSPRHVVRDRVTRRTIMKFAEKAGLVYFGYVNQRDDEHRLIRGHTVSSTHQDNHYCIGSFKGYDIMLAARNDTVRPVHSSGTGQSFHWLIMTIDLHTKHDTPHYYIGHRSRDHAFAASYEQLPPLALGSLHAYPMGFVSNYSIYAKAQDAVEIEGTISPDVGQLIDDNFDGASIELEDNTIYLYMESQRPSEGLLEKMLTNGLWLAQRIDDVYEATSTIKEEG